MSAIKGFINFLSGKVSKSENQYMVAKIVMNNLLYLISLVILLVMLGFNIVEGDYIKTGIVGGAVLILILNYFLLNKQLKPEFNGVIYLIVIALVILYEIVTNSKDETAFFWLIPFPIVALITLGFRKGSFFSLGYFLLCVLVIFLFQEYDFFKAEYDVVIVFKTFAAFIFVHFLVFVFEQMMLERAAKYEAQMVESKKESKNKDEFISKLSHQIRTPLNNIMVISNLLNETKLDDKTKDLFDNIIASTNNLVNIVNNIVKASTVEIKDIKQSKISFNLFSTIDSTIKLFLNQESDKITINFSSTEVLKKENLLGDPIKIKQIFLNLIENILKAGNGEAVVIDVLLSKANDDEKRTKLKFEINSNVEIEREKLYQDNTMGENNVNNLSLFDINITKRILAASKSKLIIIAEKEKTNFSFELSFDKAPKDKPADKSAEMASRQKAASVNIEDANVLLVEDNLINQKIVILSLSKVVKNIDVANNGKEALDKFGSSRYDLILMDIQMPVMDGIVATKKIREIESSTNSHTPIIAITANALSGDRENCIAAGMNDYISKPFQVEDLIQKMKNLLSGN